MGILENKYFNKFAKDILSLEKKAVSPLTEIETYYVRKYLGIEVEKNKIFEYSASNITGIVKNALKAVAEMSENYNPNNICESSIPFCYNEDIEKWYLSDRVMEHEEEYPYFSNSWYGSDIYLGREEISTLNLSDKVHIILRNNGIYTLGHLLSMPSYKLGEIEGLGSKEIEEIRKQLWTKFQLLFIDDIVRKYLQNYADIENKKILGANSKEKLSLLGSASPINLDKYKAVSLSDEEIEKIAKNDEVNNRLLELSVSLRYSMSDIEDVCYSLIPDENKDNREEIIAARRMYKLEEIDLSPQIYHALVDSGINSMPLLLRMSRRELKNVHGIGKTRFEELIRKLNILGINFTNDSDDAKFNAYEEIYDLIKKIDDFNRPKIKRKKDKKI